MNAFRSDSSIYGSCKGQRSVLALVGDWARKTEWSGAACGLRRIRNGRREAHPALAAAGATARDPGGGGMANQGGLVESLILAQDQRWRRA